VATITTTALGLVVRFPDSTADVSPFSYWRMPAIVEGAAPTVDHGPVLVSVEYHVDPKNAEPFLQAVTQLGRVRRRDGAFRWGIYRDVEQPDRYVETFLVTSWAEHLRQHERLTRSDVELEQRVSVYARGEPDVRHLIYADLASS
jgi:Transmembrane secretion effector